jgi:hypothetical protein
MDTQISNQIDPRLLALPRRVFLACPTYGGIDPENHMAKAAVLRKRGVEEHMGGGSLLARVFNMLWCEALNSRAEMAWTHFVMLHSDIAPERGWLDKLLDEMDRVDADVMSAVVPIKDNSGNTSTALLNAAGNEVRKLNENDLAALPATFDGSYFPDETLLVNTGVLAVRFTEPWVEKCWFEIRDRIEKRPDGTFEAIGMSEDWNFSIQCRGLGRRVFATQTIGLTHYGRMGFAREARAVDVPVPEPELAACP